MNVHMLSDLVTTATSPYTVMQWILGDVQLTLNTTATSTVDDVEVVTTLFTNALPGALQVTVDNVDNGWNVSDTLVTTALYSDNGKQSATDHLDRRGFEYVHQCQ